jgi:hypothetical protein
MPSLRLAAAFALALALAGPAAAAPEGGGRVALPAVKIEKAGACVAPAAEMRRDHMKMLMHQRDRTLRQGLREPRFSLKNCIECHASTKSGSVLGKEGFCESCHAYASVSIDCFECHSASRQSRVAARP